MSPIKAMPLLLTVLTPFVMTAGVAAAAEAPLILAQFDPQKKDEHKNSRNSTSHSRPASSSAAAPGHAAAAQSAGSAGPAALQGITDRSSTLRASHRMRPSRTVRAAHSRIRTQGVSPDAVKPRDQGSTQPQMRTQGEHAAAGA